MQCIVHPEDDTYGYSLLGPFEFPYQIPSIKIRRPQNDWWNKQAW